ncbi:MAG TPA: hypothetical protein DDX19_08045 [Rhodopirellula baltica]|uniref:Uncharacterized protein n=1 Tax=Rhodopirellula baltica (strain DSM 10527 / NCIMB 13988 / SH1) TaxID=243090 RepID=Q7UJ01_RHOBA|nr:hypothetical protein [Rhodopirellula baltica]CAD77459.1 hypothetical protein RB12220 [Rhodopirellula baltica SH 1]HBE62679.1 hypothetical protein [Rhodopirellula baltica]
MELWTWQSNGFDISKDNVNLSLSKYQIGNQAYIPAVQQLCHELGMQQVIWCYTNPDDRIATQKNQDELGYKITLPVNAIFAVLDSAVWCHIIGNPTFPRSTLVEWQHQAIELGVDLEEHEEQQKSLFRSKYPAPADLWKDLFVAPALVNPTSDKHQVVVPAPIHPDWVTPL